MNLFTQSFPYCNGVSVHHEHKYMRGPIVCHRSDYKKLRHVGVIQTHNNAANAWYYKLYILYLCIVQWIHKMSYTQIKILKITILFEN